MNRMRSTLAIVLLLGGLSFAAPAHAKRCRALCAAEIGLCRGQCSEGTRRERRRCRAACIGGVLTACREVAEPVCVAPAGGPTDEPPPTDGSDQPGTGGDGVCGPAITCESLAQKSPGWQPGSAAFIPPDFPPPPPGAQLCGTDIGSIAHYLYSGPMSEVVAYYRQQFESRGIGFTGPDPDLLNETRAGCDEVYLFDRPGRLAPGQLYLSLQQGQFTITGSNLP